VNYLPFLPRARGMIVILLAIAFGLPMVGKAQNYNSNGANPWQGRLRGDDQQRFDSYYKKWIENKQKKDKSEIASMEVRMLDLYSKNGIPSDVPYDYVASPNVALPPMGYENRGRLSGDDQKKFDSYYQRWLEYRRKKDRDQIASMEGRMLDVYSHNNISLSTPYEMVASPNVVPSVGYNQGTNPGYNPGNPGYGGDLRILQAFYGVAGRQTDVAGRLQGMVNRGSLNARVDNNTFGTDPAPGAQKQLYVVYSYQGQQRSVTVNEGSELRLPSWDSGSGSSPGYGNGDLRIMQAFYGVPGRQVDVSGRLQSLATNNGISVRVNNDSMVSDPAPGTAKQLYVVYSYRGEQRTVTVSENNELRIP